MALKACIECKKEISTDANPCPHCGKKNPHGSSAVVKYGGSFLLLMVALAVFGSLSSKREETGAVAASLVQQAESQVAPAEPVDEGPFDIKDGVYVVGDEIAPGVYRVGQYWERQDRTQSVVANDLTQGCATLAVVRPNDAYFKVQGGAVDATSTVLDPIEAGCTSGSFLVGQDIQPGKYRLTPVADMVYWERMNKNLGAIANDVGQGQRIVHIRSNDFAVKFSGATIAPL